MAAKHIFSTKTPRHMIDGIERFKTGRSEHFDVLTNDDGELSPEQAKRGISNKISVHIKERSKTCDARANAT